MKLLRQISLQAVLLSAGMIVVVSLTGCVGPMACGPFMRGGCGGGCGNTCGGGCDGGCGNTCDGGCGGGCNSGGALGSSGCRLFGGNGGCNGGGCNSCNGCGELYVDTWINEPADIHDPCDCCGNFNGQSCGACRPVFSGLKSLWGYKCDGGCGAGGCSSGGCGAGGCDGGGAGGCASCGGGGDYDGAINYSHGGESYIQGEPTLAHNGSAISVSPRGQAYQPEHTRKIFNPKRNVPARPVSTRTHSTAN